MAPTASSWAVIVSVITYSICSGSLLLMNKVALSFIPSGPLITSIQCAFVVVGITAGTLCDAPRLSPFTPAVMNAYLKYGVLFVLGIYTNMRALEASNVDTVIVFRSTVPLFVAVGDALVMGREAPSARSLFSMVVVVLGCAAFVAADAEFALHGIAAYAWTLLYVFFMSLEMLLGKAITSSLDVTLGTSVFMTNAVGLLPFLLIGASTGELNRGLDFSLWTPSAIGVVFLSCCLSAGIGFTSWWCRTLVSATTFTVIGVVNKVLTVLLNVLVWSKHASGLGTVCLLVCLAGGALYQQAPMRAVSAGGGAGAAAAGGVGGGASAGSCVNGAKSVLAGAIAVSVTPKVQPA